MINKRTFIITAIGALVSVSGLAQGQVVRLPHERAGLILNPAPRAANRAVLVTKAHPISPVFEIQTPISSRRSLITGHIRQPGPMYYGAPDNANDLIYVRIRNAPGRTLNLRAVAVDPYNRLAERLPGRYQQAQNQWLREHGYVQRARIVKRVNAGGEAVVAVKEVKKTTPTPLATIKLDPAHIKHSGGDERI